MRNAREITISPRVPAWITPAHLTGTCPTCGELLPHAARCRRCVPAGGERP